MLLLGGELARLRLRSGLALIAQAEGVIRIARTLAAAVGREARLRPMILARRRTRRPSLNCGMDLGVGRRRRRAGMVLGVAVGLDRGAPQDRGGGRVAEHLRGARGLGFAAIALVVPVALVLGPILLVIGGPLRRGLLLLGPSGLFGGDTILARLPIGGGHRHVLVLLRGLVDGPGAGQVAAGQGGLALGHAPRQGVALMVIDHHQRAVVETVAVVGVADQERIVGARLVIIVAVAAAHGLDHLLPAVIAAPDPGAVAVIVEGVVRRRLAHAVAEVGGLLDIGVVAASRRLGHGGGRRRRQLADRWGVDDRRRGGVSQGHGGGGRGRLVGGLGGAVAAGDGQAGAQERPAGGAAKETGGFHGWSMSPVKIWVMSASCAQHNVTRRR